VNVANAPQFTSGDAVRLAHDLYGLALAAESLPSERDQNFLLRDDTGPRFVLKIANRDEGLEVLDLQNKLLEFLATRDTGLEFPRLVAARSGLAITPVAAGDGAAYFVRVLTWVDGVCLAAVQPHSAALLRSLGAALARLDHALAGFEHAAAHREFYWDLRRASLAWPHLDLLPEPRRRLLQPFVDAWAAVDWSRLPTSVIYNDANDYNVLVDPAGARVVSFLDYGDVVHSATVCDLAIAIAYAMLDRPDPIAAAAEVVAGYHQVRRALHPGGRAPGGQRLLRCWPSPAGARQRIPEHQQPAGLGADRKAGVLARGLVQRSFPPRVRILPRGADVRVADRIPPPHARSVAQPVVQRAAAHHPRRGPVSLRCRRPPVPRLRQQRGARGPLPSAGECGRSPPDGAA
jgi:Ser/Thr protein kinase RdoA (MazF antagonist)